MKNTVKIEKNILLEDLTHLIMASTENGVVLMVTHGETASCFTKICQISRKKTMLSSLYQGYKTLVINNTITRFFVLKNNLCFFSVFISVTHG